MSNRNIPDSFHSAVKSAVREIDLQNETVKPKGRIIKRAVTVLACLTLVSVTAFACNEIYHKWFKNTGEYSGKISADEVTFYNAPEHVALEFSYIPANMKISEAPYKYSYNGEFGLSFNLWKMSSVDKNEYKNILSTEKTTFGDNEAEILRINGANADIALIYFEKMGTVVECYFSNSVPFEELKRILDNMKLVETTPENALVYDGTNEITSQPWVEEKLPVKIYDMGDVYGYDYDIESGAKYTVKVVGSEILDNINGIDEESIYSGFDVSEIADENGNLKKYQRENIVYGDGVNSVDYVESVETVGRKIVAVTLEIENTNNTDGSIDCSFNLCDGKLNFKATEPFSVSKQEGQGNRFYFVSVAAGTKQRVVVYNVVDDDIDFDDLYVYMEHHNMSGIQTEESLMKLEF